MHQTMCGGSSALVARVDVVIAGYGRALQIAVSIAGSSHIVSLAFLWHPLHPDCKAALPSIVTSDNKIPLVIYVLVYCSQNYF